MKDIRSMAVQNDSYIRLGPKNTALLVIDMQNGFLLPGSLLEVTGGRAIIPNITKLLAHCRGFMVPVVWVQLDASRPFAGVLLDKYPDLEAERVLFRGSTSFELYREVPPPAENDYRIVKHKYDAFHGTNLDILLRNLGVENVIITGVTSNGCCESTARSAFEHDYGVVFTADGTAAFDTQLHEQTLDGIRELFGRVMTVDEIIDELNQQRD